MNRFSFPIAMAMPRAVSLRAAAMLCALLIAFLLPASHALAEGGRQLRVCADPNNLPFSNRREEGFENRIAEILAEELNASVQYTWWAQRRGFIRNTLKAGNCDLVIAAPKGFELAATSKPYYRSTYVFVYRKDRGYTIRSFDDPVLRRLKVGVHLMGDDYAATPPGHALTRRKMIDNVVGFTIFGDYSQPDPPARILDALVAGDIDVAVVWGPLAGYYARKAVVPLEVVPVSPRAEHPLMAMEFDIGLAVRHGDKAFQRELELALERRSADIRKVLTAYGIPQLPLEAKPQQDEER